MKLSQQRHSQAAVALTWQGRKTANIGGRHLDDSGGLDNQQSAGQESLQDLTPKGIGDVGIRQQRLRRLSWVPSGPHVERHW